MPSSVACGVTRPGRNIEVAFNPLNSRNATRFSDSMSEEIKFFLIENIELSSHFKL
jgi:hypothetical protein